MSVEPQTLPFMIKRLAALLLTLICFFACTKNETPPSNNNTNDPPKQDTPKVVVEKRTIPVYRCRVIEADMLSANGDTIHHTLYQYDSLKRLIWSYHKNLSFIPDTAFYTYNGNIIYRSVLAGPYSSVDTITLNSQGFMVLDKEVAQPNSSVYIATYNYDQNNYLTSANFGGMPLNDLRYAHGDLIFSSDGTNTDSLFYDTTKLAVPGNMDQYNSSLGFGATTGYNKHLLIKDKHQGAEFDYSYTFDADGNISTISISQNGQASGRIVYVYECH